MSRDVYSSNTDFLGEEIEKTLFREYKECKKNKKAKKKRKKKLKKLEKKRMKKLRKSVEKKLEKKYRKKYKESECGLTTENLENFMKMIVLDFISRNYQNHQNHQNSHGKTQRQIENNQFIDIPYEDIN